MYSLKPLCVQIRHLVHSPLCIGIYTSLFIFYYSLLSIPSNKYFMSVSPLTFHLGLRRFPKGTWSTISSSLSSHLSSKWFDHRQPLKRCWPGWLTSTRLTWRLSNSNLTATAVRSLSIPVQENHSLSIPVQESHCKSSWSLVKSSAKVFPVFRQFFKCIRLSSQIFSAFCSFF